MIVKICTSRDRFYRSTLNDLRFSWPLWPNHQILDKTFDDEAFSKSRTFKCSESIKGDQRLARLSTDISLKNAWIMKLLLMRGNKSYISLRKLYPGYIICRIILTRELDRKIIVAKWIAQLSTQGQRIGRVQTCTKRQQTIAKDLSVLLGFVS